MQLDPTTFFYRNFIGLSALLQATQRDVACPDCRELCVLAETQTVSIRNGGLDVAIVFLCRAVRSSKPIQMDHDHI